MRVEISHHFLLHNTVKFVVDETLLDFTILSVLTGFSRTKEKKNTKGIIQMVFLLLYSSVLPWCTRKVDDYDKLNYAWRPRFAHSDLECQNTHPRLIELPCS